MATDWKDLLAAKTGYVPSAEPETDTVATADALTLPHQSKIKIQLDRKQRAGKSVTLIFDLEGSESAVKALAKELKVTCGVGGSSRGCEIL
ncbi:MAG: translation initiation factor, partial [Muribaculaceae bacterium]|nr:translation initiation factor [Muribaculaceae bacterium]